MIVPSLASLGFDSFSNVFMTLTSFEEYWLYILESVPLSGFVWCFSHTLTGFMCMGGRAQPQRYGAFLLMSYQWHTLSRSLVPVADLDRLAKVILSRFLPCEITLLTCCPLSILCCLGGSYRGQPILKEWGAILLLLLEAEYLPKLLRTLLHRFVSCSPLINLFNHLY